MKLSDLKFDKVYCINLPHRTDRRASVMLQLRRLGIEAEFFSGINAVDLRLASQDSLKPGMVGCYLSHYFLLQHALLNNYERILILEDDINLIKGGEALLNYALPVLPADWEFAWLGYTLISGEKHRMKPVNDFWIVPSPSWGTQAYMINGRHAIQKIFDMIQQMKLQIDIQLAYQVLPNSGLKYYAITPSCLRQEGGRSDVQ